MQVLYKPFEAIPFKQFKAITFRFHINIYIYICAWEKLVAMLMTLAQSHAASKVVKFEFVPMIK